MRAVRSVPTELANPGQSLEVMFTNRWESGWVVEEVYDDLPASDYRKEVRPSVL